MTLPPAFDVLAPDGSEVRVLLSLAGGSMAHFRLPSGQVSRAVRHRTVEEIWYVLSGRGEMWRSGDGEAAVVALEPGTCVTIPAGVAFQFRSLEAGALEAGALEAGALEAVAITMPPWPGADEAVFTEGVWPPTPLPSPHR